MIALHSAALRPRHPGKGCLKHTAVVVGSWPRREDGSAACVVGSGRQSLLAYGEIARAELDDLRRSSGGRESHECEGNVE